VPKVKGVELSGLNKRQISAMRKHAKHHTAKHLRMMVSRMKKGATFTASHKQAQRKVGT
jgi:ferritin-like protein|tara:strand:+ start:235 stop:411 length:177 start_codon:yes stop_codon:yes gene_type:complete